MSFLSQNKTFKRNWNWLRPVPAAAPPSLGRILTTSGSGGILSSYVSDDFGATWAIVPDLVYGNCVPRWNGSAWQFAADGVFAESVDLVSYTEEFPPLMPFSNRIAENAGVTMVCGQNGVVRRVSGVWSFVSVPIGDVTDILYDGSQWIACGTTGPGPTFYDSAFSTDNGLTWTALNSFIAGAPGGGGSRRIGGFTETDSDIVAGGSFWNASQSAGIWTNSIPAVMGGIWSTFFPLPLLGNSWSKGVSAGGTTVIPALLGAAVAVRVGAGAWTAVNFSAAAVFDVVYADGTFIALCENGTVYRSADGLVWSLVGDLTAAGWTWGGLNGPIQTAVGPTP